MVATAKARVIAAIKIIQYVRLSRKLKSLEEKKRELRDELANALSQGGKCSMASPWVLRLRFHQVCRWTTSDRLAAVLDSLPPHQKKEAMALLERMLSETEVQTHLVVDANPEWNNGRRGRGE